MYSYPAAAAASAAALCMYAGWLAGWPAEPHTLTPAWTVPPACDPQYYYPPIPSRLLSEGDPGVEVTPSRLTLYSEQAFIYPNQHPTCQLPAFKPGWRAGSGAKNNQPRPHSITHNELAKFLHHHLLGSTWTSEDLFVSIPETDPHITSDRPPAKWLQQQRK